MASERAWRCADCGELHGRTAEFQDDESPMLPNHHAYWEAVEVVPGEEE